LRIGWLRGGQGKNMPVFETPGEGIPNRKQASLRTSRRRRGGQWSRMSTGRDRKLSVSEEMPRGEIRGGSENNSRVLTWYRSRGRQEKYNTLGKIATCKRVWTLGSGKNVDRLERQWLWRGGGGRKLRFSKTLG